MTVDIALDIMHARFPPGVLLPLLDAASASGRRCKLNARRSADDCQLVLELGAPPSQTSVTRVGSLLTELYGAGASLEIQSMDGAVDVIVTIAYEPA